MTAGDPDSSLLHKGAQHFRAFVGEDGLGVELQAVDRQCLVLEGHDQAVFALGCDGEAVGQGLGIDHQGVVAADFNPRGQVGEHRAGAVELDGRAFAVDRDGRVDDARAEGFANALVAEADAEHRDFACEMADHGGHDAGIGWIAGSG